MCIRDSNIVVGEDLKKAEENGGDLYWKILSGLTGVSRTRDEAIALMGASFCLTADRYDRQHVFLVDSRFARLICSKFA